MGPSSRMDYSGGQGDKSISVSLRIDTCFGRDLNKRGSSTPSSMRVSGIFVCEENPIRKMFTFAKHKKTVDLYPYIRRICDLTTPNLATKNAGRVFEQMEWE